MGKGLSMGEAIRGAGMRRATLLIVVNEQNMARSEEMWALFGPCHPHPLGIYFEAGLACRDDIRSVGRATSDAGVRRSPADGARLPDTSLQNMQNMQNAQC